jgi:membrane protein DedA with SNARE-associated domain
MTLEMHFFLLSSQHWLAKMGSFVSAFISSFGGVGVMCLAFADSSFFSLPEGNDLLIVVLSAGKSWGTMAYFVGMTVIGSVIGCLFLYLLGSKGGSPMLRRKFSKHSIDRAEKLFERYGIMAVLVPSILPPPFPFKVFVLSAGVFRLKIPEFLIAVIIGRTLRYAAWGILAVLYGNAVKQYMQKNMNLTGIILIICFLIVAAVSLFFYLRRRKFRGSANQ